MKLTEQKLREIIRETIKDLQTESPAGRANMFAKSLKQEVLYLVNALLKGDKSKAIIYLKDINKSVDQVEKSMKGM